MSIGVWKKDKTSYPLSDVCLSSLYFGELPIASNLLLRYQE